MMTSAQIHNLDGNNQLALTRASSTLMLINGNHIAMVGAATLALQLLLPCSNISRRQPLNSGDSNTSGQHHKQMDAA